MSRRILDGLGSLLLVMAVGLAPCSASPTANSPQLSTFSQEPVAPSFIHSGIHSGNSLDPMVLVTSEPLKRAIVTIKTDAGAAVSPQRLQQVIAILARNLGSARYRVLISVLGRDSDQRAAATLESECGNLPYLS